MSLQKIILECTEWVDYAKICFRPTTIIRIVINGFFFDVKCLRTNIRIEESESNTLDRFQAANHVYKANNS